MAIIIKHTHSASVEIQFMGQDDYTFRHRITGTMDDIAEHICDMFVAHNFTSADVCDANTGEILMQLERT